MTVNTKFLNGNGQWVAVGGMHQTITIPATSATTTNWTYQITVNGGYTLAPTPPAQQELDLNDAQKKIDAYDRAMKGIG